MKDFSEIVASILMFLSGLYKAWKELQLSFLLKKHKIYTALVSHIRFSKEDTPSRSQEFFWRWLFFPWRSFYDSIQLSNSSKHAFYFF